MPNDQQEIQLDDEVLTEVVNTLKSFVDNLNELADAAETEAERMADELKGDDGQIPPIYQDIGSALIETAKRMKKVNGQLVTMILNDAKTVKNQMEQQADVQSTGASNVENIDANLA